MFTKNTVSDQQSTTSFSGRNGMFLSIIFAYFLIRLIYLATHIHHAVPPDETTHFGICQEYAKAFFIPENSESTFHLGVITHQPYLYYFLMGKLMHLNFLPIQDLVFLRLINVIFGLLTLVYAWKWIRILTKDSSISLFFMILLTNTLMFSFMFSSVNYDNLANLFAAMAFYYSFLYFENKNPKALILFGISLFGGALTKTAFLPIGFILTALLLFNARKELKPFITGFQKNISSYSKNPANTALLLILLLFTGLNLLLYGSNIIKFKKLVPRSDQVLSMEQCMKNRIFARNQIPQEFRNGNLTYEAALNETKKILDKGDRNAAIIMIQNIQRLKNNSLPILDRITYFFPWAYFMFERTFSLVGHKMMVKSSYSLSIYFLLFGLAFIKLLRLWRPKATQNYPLYAIICITFYALVLMQLVNYSAYRSNGVLSIGLQGRYIFPVLIPLYGVLAIYISQWKNAFIKWIVILSVACIFIYGDFITLYRNLTPEWLIQP